MNTYDVIVIGGGHAGIEAACASAKMGCRTALFTMDTNAIGRMSCNPAVGGVGKGQLVKEIDALGGQMARVTDICGIQFRILNASKGQAVRSSRAQVDMAGYSRAMQDIIFSRENVFVREAHVTGLIVRERRVRGVMTAAGEEIEAVSVVVAPGTFLDGTIHVGLRNFSAGRIGEPAAVGLAGDLRSHGLACMRFKTGTCPRLDAGSIDFSSLVVQHGDDHPRPFSFLTRSIPQQQVPCHITYTNKRTHEIIRANLDRSPLYAGIIQATGVRYCPSIEDKVVRFSDRDRHQIFLEPEGRSSVRVYPNGLSTSLPEDVQDDLIHSIPGLENARVVCYGYGIEHTVIDPTQLYPTLETKTVGNLYLAGQINGTTGYEEAAAQGLLAGINAALRVQKRAALVLDRSTGYIGVLVDDLTTKGTREPYRMFTSRVEYRLLAREDNADVRLGKIGYELGLVDEASYRRIREKSAAVSRGIDFLRKTRVKPDAKVNGLLERIKSPLLKKPVTLEALLKRPGVGLEDIRELGGAGSVILCDAREQVEVEVKYAGFIERQLKDVERFRNLEKIRIPPDMDYSSLPGISREIRDKLRVFKPLNLGQASRISGVTPAAISLLMVYVRRRKDERRA